MILRNESMAKHTTFKVGGNADYLCIPDTMSELLETLRHGPKPITIIGNGSNLIVRDGGIRGTVIKICNVFDNIKVVGNTMVVGAGTPIQKVINTAIQHNLMGVEILSGIPGTIGGTICMNGGYTDSISTIINAVRVSTLDGTTSWFSKEEAEFSYRNSCFLDGKHIILDAILQLKYGDCSQLVKQYTQGRRQSQPIQYPSCGSIFKNANLDSVRGLRVGDAEVSSLCSSFIINRGNATATDIMDLIDLIEKKLGRVLELEAQIIGEKL